MNLSKRIIQGIFVSALCFVLAHGLLLTLNSMGYFPEQWVSRLIGGFVQSQPLHWLFAGIIGLSGLLAWERFNVSERLRSLGITHDAEIRVLEIIYDENDPRCVRQRTEGTVNLLRTDGHL
jgi:hypothetical protein